MSSGRRCKTCGHKKDLNQFALKKDGKDGRSSRCKTCAAVRQALYRQSPEGMAVARSYLLDHPEKRDQKLEKLNQWRQANPERIREIKRAYRQTPLAKLLQVRRRAVIALERSVTPEEQQSWSDTIASIDQCIKSCRLDSASKG